MDDLRQLVENMTPAELQSIASTLEGPELAMLEQTVASLTATHWRSDPARMANHLTRGRYRLLAHNRAMSEFFVRVITKGTRRGIILVPAQHWKSTTISQWGSAWYLDAHPDHNLILVSYGDELANKNAIAVRDILREHKADLAVELRRDVQRQDRFLTNAGGGLLAAGIRSSMTGFPAHGIVIDDPFKNWIEAHSESTRNTIWEQYRSVVRLRLTDDEAWIFVVMTAWHEDDLGQKLMSESTAQTGEQWEVLSLPAFAEKNDPLGRVVGETLGRFSPEFYERSKLALGSYLHAALNQQRPAPEEGGELKRAWWRIEDTAITKADDWASSWDMKLKEKESGDYVVGQIWGRTGPDMWCIDQVRGRWSQAITKVAIALLAVRHPYVRRHYIENTGYGPEVIEQLRQPSPNYKLDPEIAGQLGVTESERPAVEKMLRRGMQGLIPVTVKGDKRVRVRAISPLIEAGNVHLAPASAGWVLELVNEAAAFPNASHDDQVDAMSQALAKMSRGGSTVRRASGQVPPTPIAAVRRLGATGPRIVR